MRFIFLSSIQEVIMTTPSELNLISVFVPVCLMKCKSTLNALQSGETLDVLIADPEVVANLERIIERSDDRVISRRKELNYYRLRILKK
jgi:TusA-related sulfurtransferase